MLASLLLPLSQNTFLESSQKTKQILGECNKQHFQYASIFQQLSHLLILFHEYFHFYSSFSFFHIYSKFLISFLSKLYANNKQNNSYKGDFLKIYSLYLFVFFLVDYTNFKYFTKGLFNNISIGYISSKLIR